MIMMRVLRKISISGLRESLHLLLVFLGFLVKYLSKAFGNILDDIFIIRKWYLYSCSNKEKGEFGAEAKFYKSINPTGNYQSITKPANPHYWKNAILCVQSFYTVQLRSFVIGYAFLGPIGPLVVALSVIMKLHRKYTAW